MTKPSLCVACKEYMCTLWLFTEKCATCWCKYAGRRESYLSVKGMVESPLMTGPGCS